MRRWLPLLLALGLAACASTPGPQSNGEETKGPLNTHAAVEHRVDNHAVALLWDKAEKARRDNRLDDAVSALERALRLTPDDAVIWSRLAELRLRQRKYAVAENLAAKSNSLAGKQRLLRYRNWLIIEAARERRGDTAGAVEARERADALSGS